MEPGEVPGLVGRSVCGRRVMDHIRAVHLWEVNSRHTPAPRLDEVLPCESCTRITGVMVVVAQGGKLPDTVAAYARQAGRYELEVRKDNELLREVMTMFSEGHDLTGRSRSHPECSVCRLLKRIRHRLASPDRVAIGA
jgi:hypothetical protein